MPGDGGGRWETTGDGRYQQKMSEISKRWWEKLGEAGGRQRPMGNNR